VKTESQIKRRLWPWLIVLALAIAALVCAFFCDAAVASRVNTNASAHVKHWAVVVSRVGDWPAHVALGVVGVAAAFFARRRDWLRIFLAMLIACALAGIGARIIKIATGRARPSIKTETMWNGPQFRANYNAFPSGHTASSAAFFASLVLARRKLGAPFLLIPLLIALARILSGAHYLSDVTFAAALGLACALLTSRLLSTSQPLNPSTNHGCQQQLHS